MIARDLRQGLVSSSSVLYSVVRQKPRPSVPNIYHTRQLSLSRMLIFAHVASTSLQDTLHTNLDAGQAVEYGAI